MTGHERELRKEERHRLIVSVVARRRVGTQHELQEVLAKAGCAVTQATLSRDLRELGVEKVDDAFGRPRYVLPGRARSDPREALAAILAQARREVIAAQNVVVVRTEVGTAGAVARALDRAEHPLVVGTLAGDDTCLVIAKDAAAAEALARELS
ncbi:MAG TPA: arginine repressor [Gaiellaceae bacterium]|nr:arginine repressor [Gaiellaceae bacterium]